jgi:hypothetical protein
MARMKLTTIERVAKIQTSCQCAKIEGVIVDTWTAGVIMAVHKALNEVNRAKFESLGIEKMARVAMKLIK